MGKLQERVSTAKRINRPSDDPIGIGKSLALRANGQQFDQYLNNISAARSLTEYSISAQQQISNILTRAKEIATRGASDSLGASERQALSEDVNELLDSLLQIVNTKREGRFLFAGTKTSTTPFEATRSAEGQITSVNFKGNLDAIEYEIGPGATIRVNQSGNPNVFSDLIGLRDDLETASQNPGANGESISDNLPALEVTQGKVLDQIADLGVRLRRLELTNSRITEAKNINAKSLSDVEDTDMTDAIVRLRNQELVSQAALMAAAKIVPPTLLEFLR